MQGLSLEQPAAKAAKAASTDKPEYLLSTLGKWESFVGASGNKSRIFEVRARSPVPRSLSFKVLPLSVLL